jgi:hypothetical protein
MSFKNNKILKPGDTSDVILQVRKRLFITRDLKLILKKTYLTMSY